MVMFNHTEYTEVIKCIDGLKLESTDWELYDDLSRHLENIEDSSPRALKNLKDAFDQGAKNSQEIKTALKAYLKKFYMKDHDYIKDRLKDLVVSNKVNARPENSTHDERLNRPKVRKLPKSLSKGLEKRSSTQSHKGKRRWSLGALFK